jgi:N utilization substance protein B
VSGDATGDAEGERPARVRRGHRHRRTARRLALDLLYQADIRGTMPAAALGEWRAAGRDVPAYTEELIEGVQADLPRIDALLGEHAEGWTVPRMATVDRAILRLACFELLAGVPSAVAIDEAVDAAQTLSTEASGRFVNGVLGAVARAVAPDAQP